MRSIRWKMTLALAICAGLIAYFSYLAGRSYKTFAGEGSELATSYKVGNAALSLATSHPSKSALAYLRQTVKSTELEARKKSLQFILAAHKRRSHGELQSQVAFLENNEIRYRDYLQKRLDYHRNRAIYYGALTIGLIFLTFVFITFYVQTTVFNPIKQLSQRMVDFLNQKYTYEFSVPAPNEVGRLQATFNSLAQTVLNNMEELKALDKAKSEFLSIASHELRTPLTSIKGSLSLLNAGVAGELNGQSSHLVTIAETETDRLIRLINDLLDLAKIEARKFPLNKNWYSLNEIIQKTAQSLQGLANTAEVNICVDVPYSLEAYVDHDRIQQVVTNLLSNAIKYSPKGGTATVTVFAEEGDPVKIAVTDQGRGIAPDDQEIIFEQFRQATSPKNPLVKGTGLGLAIAKALVDEHGGEMSVHSAPDQGATFYFTVPQWRPRIVEESHMQGVAA